MALISLQNVSLGFGGSRLFEEINLQIEQGEWVGLVRAGRLRHVSPSGGSVLFYDKWHVTWGLKFCIFSQRISITAQGSERE